MKTQNLWTARTCLLLTPFALASLNGCTPAGHAATTKTTGTEPPVVSGVASVVTQAVRVGDVAQTVAVTGSLVALQDVSLSAKQGGRLAEVTVREGDSVVAGQILARVDATDLISQVRADEAGVASALAKLEQARAAYAQQTTNTQASIASARAAFEQQVATSSAQVRSARSALASARANLSTLQEGARPEERLQTQATLASAQANYKKAQADVARYEKLHNAGAVSDAEMDQYLNTREVSLASLNSAQATLRLQEQGNRRQDIEQAEEKVRQAEESLQQAEAARATDAVRKADLETALALRTQNAFKKADIQAAQAALQQAQNTLAIARQAVEDTLVRAPISGRVSVRSAEPGQVVKSDTSLLHIIALDSVYFEPSVPNNALEAIRVGQRVALRVDAYPSRLFQGSITRIYPQSSSTSRTLPIRVTLSNHQGLLLPNMFAQGNITTAIHRNAVLIPRTALIQKATNRKGTSEQEETVFTVENGVAHERAVTPGLIADKIDKNGDWIEAKGLKASTQVVTLGQRDLKDGQTVTATPSAQQ